MSVHGDHGGPVRRRVRALLLLLALLVTATGLAGPAGAIVVGNGPATVETGPGAHVDAAPARLDRNVLAVTAGLVLAVGLVVAGRGRLARRIAVQRFRRQLRHPDLIALAGRARPQIGPHTKRPRTS